MKSADSIFHGLIQGLILLLGLQASACFAHTSVGDIGGYQQPFLNVPMDQEDLQRYALQTSAPNKINHRNIHSFYAVSEHPFLLQGTNPSPLPGTHCLPVGVENSAAGFQCFTMNGELTGVEFASSDKYEVQIHTAPQQPVLIYQAPSLPLLLQPDENRNLLSTFASQEKEAAEIHGEAMNREQKIGDQLFKNLDSKYFRYLTLEEMEAKHQGRILEDNADITHHQADDHVIKLNNHFVTAYDQTSELLPDTGLCTAESREACQALTTKIQAYGNWLTSWFYPPTDADSGSEPESNNQPGSSQSSSSQTGYSQTTSPGGTSFVEHRPDGTVNLMASGGSCYLNGVPVAGTESSSHGNYGTRWEGRFGDSDSDDSSSSSSNSRQGGGVQIRQTIGGKVKNAAIASGNLYSVHTASGSFFQARPSDRTHRTPGRFSTTFSASEVNDMAIFDDGSSTNHNVTIENSHIQNLFEGEMGKWYEKN